MSVPVVSAEPDAPLLRLHVAVQPERVSVIREFLEHYLATVPGLSDDADLVARLGVAAHEMLENAARYSAGPLASVRLGLAGGPSNGAVWVEVGSMALPEHLDELVTAVNELIDDARAAEKYEDAMTSSPTKSDAPRLGLARIRVELDMRIGLEVSGRSVKVMASVSGGK